MHDDNLLWLQKWYYSHCNQDWEHGSIIHIETIDNPGWSITINLEDTDYKNKEFDKIKIERSDNNWIFCQVKASKFEGRCGPLNFSEILQIFRNWVEEKVG